MIKLNFVIICDNAVIDEKTKNLSLLGIFNTIGAKSLPAVHPKFNIVTKYTGDPGSYTQIIVIKHKESQEEVAKLQSQFNITISKAQFIGNFLNVPLRREGEYEVEVFVDERIQDLKTNFILKLYA